MNTKNTPPVLAIKAVSVLLDAAALFMSYALALFFIAQFSNPAFATLSGHYQNNMITCVLSACAVIMFTVIGHYTKREPWWNQILSVVKIITAMLAVDLIARSTINYGHVSLFPVMFWLFAFASIVLDRYILYVLKTKVAAWKIPVVIIADDRTVTDILYALSSDLSVGYDPQYILMRGDADRKFQKDEAPPIFKNIKLQNGRENYADFITQNLNYHYIISMETFRAEDRDNLLRLLNNEDVQYSLVPMISQMSLYKADPLYFFGNDVMFIETKRYKLSWAQRATKRAFDIFAAAMGLLLLAIPLVIIACRLKKECPEEAVFYSGSRVGKDQKTFRCWKFRTMETDSDHLLETYLAENPDKKVYWDRYQKLPDDPRVKTKITKFIRKTSIDELPQLWNVLIGDMSIVGPRPILPKEIELYGSPIKDYASVKPGITGLWQVSGRSETSFNRRIVWDRWYIRNWSHWGDIVIIIKTALVVLNSKGAS